MPRKLPPELASLVDTISLTYTREQFLRDDLPSVENWHVTVTAHVWTEDNSADRTEDVAHLHLVKGSLVYESLWDDLDATEADVSTVASAILDIKADDLRDEVLDRVDGSGSSVLILNSVRLATRWRGFGIGALIAGQAILGLDGDAHVVATYPAPLDGSEGEARDRAVRKLQGVWTRLGFSHLRDGVYILDPARKDLQEAMDQMRAGVGLT
jgi:hypothetical protein